MTEEQIREDQKIKNQILNFEKSIFVYRETLNTESFWLLLAILGCWSVSHYGIQLFAIATVFIIFVHRVWIKQKGFKLFATSNREIGEAINKSQLPSQIKNDRKYDLKNVNGELSFIKVIFKTWGFYLCMIFLGLTLWYWFDTMPQAVAQSTESP